MTYVATIIVATCQNVSVGTMIYHVVAIVLFCTSDKRNFTKQVSWYLCTETYKEELIL
jgi:hypothetical protein